MKENNAIAPRWIKLKEATKYAAMGKKRLIDLTIAGDIKGFQDDTKRKDWIFDRLSIDAYREAQMPVMNDREIALAILEDVKRKGKKKKVPPLSRD
jgi:hypothetical protein